MSASGLAIAPNDPHYKTMLALAELLDGIRVQHEDPARFERAHRQAVEHVDGYLRDGIEAMRIEVKEIRANGMQSASA
jgi:hypothetical protein